ncbi:MAG: hypothetical protein JNL07_03310, partial [Rhodospirillales bacterium]|nr:hypothetical protein [Rhodospirillales bacterium]
MRLNPLSGRWPDTPLAHVAGGAVAAVAVAVVSGLVAALRRRQDDIASAPDVAAFWFVMILAIGVLVAFMGSLAYAASRGVRPSSLRWVLLTLVQLAPIGLLLLHLARTTRALVGPWHLLSIAGAHALWNVVFIAGCRPTMLDAVAGPPLRVMELSRGGYASIDPAEALR